MYTGQNIGSPPFVVGHQQALDSTMSPVHAVDQAGSNSALVLAIGGSAVATGANTLADGTIYSTVKDLGPITEAIGYASFVAAANSQPGSPAAADANTFANVSGADLVFEVTEQTGPVVGSGGTAVSTSQTEVIAIDIPGWTPPNGPVELDVTIHEPSLTQTVGERSGSGEVALLGHLATIAANANAIGPDTLAETNTFAQTDNTFSFVSGLSISGIA